MERGGRNQSTCQLRTTVCSAGVCNTGTSTATAQALIVGRKKVFDTQKGKVHAK